MAKEWRGLPFTGRPQTRWIAVATIAVFSALVLVSGRVTQSIGVNASFLPAMLAVVACAEGLTALVLFQKFLAGGRGRLVGVACAYLFSALMIIPHALAFPGVVTAHGPLATSASTATWFWVAWHVGFPLTLAAGLLTASWTERWTVTQRRRRAAVASCTSIVVGVVATLTAAIVAGHDALPVIIVNGNFTRLTELAGPWIIGANVVALLIAVGCTRKTDGMIAWVPVAAAASLGDTMLVLLSESRYTIGWYTGRSLSLVTANVVLAALLVEFNRLYRASESDRRALEDEAIDLLRQKRAEMYRAERIRRVIENAADAYVEIGPDNTIQAWNSKAQEMFGWNPDDVEGRPIAGTIMPPAGADQCLTLLGEFWHSDDRFDGGYAELLVIDRNGCEFPVEATMWVDESDFAPRMSFFLRDITARKETQEKLQRALTEERKALLRLQEIDRIKSNFVSSISHELRSPLTNTLGYLELLADGDAGALTEPQVQMVGIAQRNARRLFALIEDLLTLSRVEEGGFSVRFRPVLIQDVLAEVRSTNDTVAQERDIDIVLNIDGQLGVCPGDASQMTRALSNIVNNAVKFSDGGSTVRIDAHQENGEMVIVVTDAGIGVPPEEQPKVFERFFRTSVSVEHQFQGAGLGLTITKAIIDHHGGSITVDSQLAKGTTVTVRLPALPAVPEPSVTVDEAASGADATAG